MIDSVTKMLRSNNSESEPGTFTVIAHQINCQLSSIGDLTENLHSDVTMDSISDVMGIVVAEGYV